MNVLLVYFSVAVYSSRIALVAPKIAHVNGARGKVYNQRKDSRIYDQIKQEQARIKKGFATKSRNQRAAENVMRIPSKTGITVEGEQVRQKCQIQWLNVVCDVTVTVRQHKLQTIYQVSQTITRSNTAEIISRLSMVEQGWK